MKILIVGSGGREHVLAWKIQQSPLVKEIFCAPGNGGIASMAICVDIEAHDIEALLTFAQKNKIDLTVVGPEVPLVKGIVDVFEREGLTIFGPSQAAAQLEGSKSFSKEFMQEYQIPTAPFETFDNFEDAQAFLAKVEFPVVIKADGLAAGKGVVICQDREEATETLTQMMKDKIFKEAGGTVVIEACLEGEEASILVISDGEDYVILDSSQDHKRIFDDDLGPNTGGMGSYSPAPVVTPQVLNMVEAQVILPTIRGMHQQGIPFKGVLYVGIMLTAEGPMVLEYNVRLGDPEAQVILLRMKNDIVEVMMAACQGRLNAIDLAWESKDCVCVVMSSGGYPGQFETGFEIKGLDVVALATDTYVFHAGTELIDGRLFTSGGRVLGVTALGDGIEDAIKKAYVSVENIKFEHSFFRRDIGEKALKRVSVSSTRRI